MNEPRDTDVHTCHAECPCQTGGKPLADFIAADLLLDPHGEYAAWEASQYADPEDAP